MVAIRIYVEGGGDQSALQTKCRRGFSKFFEKLSFAGMPKIIACGSRKKAYDMFCKAIEQYPQSFCLLLVDSEAPVESVKERWKHVEKRNDDKWIKPVNAEDDNLFFMVQCMETWFLADKQCLAAYFGQGFNEKALPKHADIEKIYKKDIFDSLKKATKNTKTKGKYGKGSHSFEILSRIDPIKVKQKSPHARKLFNKLIEMTLFE